MHRRKYSTIKPPIGLCRRIEDPHRSWGNKLHELTGILIIALLAMVCGCEGGEEICDYGHMKEMVDNNSASA